MDGFTNIVFRLLCHIKKVVVVVHGWTNTRRRRRRKSVVSGNPNSFLFSPDRTCLDRMNHNNWRWLTHSALRMMMQEPSWIYIIAWWSLSAGFVISSMHLRPIYCWFAHIVIIILVIIGYRSANADYVVARRYQKWWWCIFCVQSSN